MPALYLRVLYLSRDCHCSGTERASIEQYCPQWHGICGVESRGNGRFNQEMVHREVWRGKVERAVENGAIYLLSSYALI